MSESTPPFSIASLPQEGVVRPIRSNLAEAYTLEGELALLKGDLDKAIECFDSAVKLHPHNAPLFFSQALSLFDFAVAFEDDKGLFLSHKKLKQAATLDPHHFDTFRIWGSLLCLLGTKTHEIHYFKEAKDKLSHALVIGKHQEKKVLAEIHWDIGVAFSKLAEHSQEALDWHQSIQSFEIAKSCHDALPASFWIDYGYAQLKLAGSLNDIRSFVKAVQSFKKAASLDPQGFESYHFLAQTMQKLFFYTHDEEHSQEACDYFEMALSLQKDSFDLLLEYATFLVLSGEKSQDLRRLRQSLEICKQLEELQPNNKRVLSLWIEALAHLGHRTERLDLLHEAERLFEKIPEDEKECPAVYFSMGLLLKAQASYFQDIDYDYQAIEQFQAGLSLDRTQHRLWHAMASSYAFLGDKEESEENFRLALRFFQKALDLSSSTYIHFDYAHTLTQLGDFLNRESYLEQAIKEFEHLFHMQRNALYLHPDWLLAYGHTLDLLGNFREDPLLYEKAIEVFSHLLTLNPDCAKAHHYLALSLSHLGELNLEKIHFERALHHYRLALKQEETEEVILDWASTLIHLSLCSDHSADADLLFRDAEQKLEALMRQGSTDAYYLLACLYSITHELEKSLYYLEKAKLAHVCPPLDELLEDDWLEELRSTSAFQSFLEQFNLSE